MAIDRHGLGQRYAQIRGRYNSIFIINVSMQVIYFNLHFY